MKRNEVEFGRSIMLIPKPCSDFESAWERNEAVEHAISNFEKLKDNITPKPRNHFVPIAYWPTYFESFLQLKSI